MKTKLEMAHEYAMKHIQEGWDINYDVLVVDAWAYVDAMQAEADKREKEEIEKQSAELRNILNLSNSKPLELQPDVEEWQPDWSQAPEWANWWVAVANQSGKITGGWFYDVEPEFGESKGVSIYYSFNGNNILTDSFGYTGDWRNSLRKRPK